jgi:hypothetical protein
MNITSEFFNFNMWEWFLHSSVLEQIESDLSKINWLRGVIVLHSNSVSALGQVSIVSHSYQTYFGFPGSDLNLDCGLRDHVITRFVSCSVRKSAHPISIEPNERSYLQPQIWIEIWMGRRIVLVSLL